MGPLSEISWTSEHENTSGSFANPLALTFQILNAAVFSKPTVIKWIVNWKLLQRRAYTVHHLERAYCVGYVIIVRSCGTLPAFAAILLALALDFVMKLWKRLCCLKAVVYFFFRLDSDLEIRLERMLRSVPATFFVVLQSQLTKLSAIHRWKLILASRLKVITWFSGHPSGYPGFRLRSTLHTSLKWNMRLSGYKSQN